MLKLGFILTLFGCSFARWDEVTRGDESLERTQRYRALDYSVKFLLTVDNYANQQLTVSQSIITSGVIVDDAKDIGPGMYEAAMSGRKTWWTATGVHGVASWKIGDTGKMVVVMYDVPYDHLWYINTLAVGIFPQGDISGHYDIMYSGVEDGFQRVTSGRASEELWFGDDPDYAIRGIMAETSDTGIQIWVYPRSEHNLANEDDYDDFPQFLREMDSD